MLDRVEIVQDEESCSDLYRRYLRDYIRCVHQVTHNESLLEYKVRRSSESKIGLKRMPILCNRIVTCQTIEYSIPP